MEASQSNEDRYDTTTVQEQRNQHIGQYRPISILTSISSLCEGGYKGLITLLEQINRFYNYQYGFRQKRSTITAVTEFVSDTLQAFNEKIQCFRFIKDI